MRYLKLKLFKVRISKIIKFFYTALGKVLFLIFFENDSLHDYIEYRMGNEDKKYIEILSTITQEIIDGMIDKYISNPLFSVEEVPPSTNYG